MYKTLFTFLVIFALAGQSNALSLKKPAKPAVHHQLRIDSTKLSLQHFDSASIKNYRKDPTFNYVEAKQGITWWDRFWMWVWDVWDRFWIWIGHLLERLFGSVKVGKQAASVFNYVLLGLGAFLIVYVILKLIGVDLLGIFRKKQTVTEVPYTEYLENIHEINFDEAIENALLIKDYRLAVRLLYLRCLKQLSDSNLINWKIEKTNNVYLNEISDAEQRRLFSIVTRQFEYVWYGDFPVDGQSFQNINAIFQEFKNRVS
ncbi:MAG: hypothetical protein JWP37_4096 [Mucilaginibacter sp.]|nr:hypothetical protein [Mucilaginibacter sp.]